MDSSAILLLENVTRQFSQTATPAVAGVSLSLHPSEILALLGPSGCGKTTLLRLIAGFEQPQAGHIALAGQVVAGQGYWVAPERRDIGMVFQDYALFPHLTVAENVAFGLQRLNHRQGSQSSSFQQRIREAIALVNLSGLESRYPHELSGGQQQRVALARALAPRPALVLLDEPLSNLDVQVRLYLRREIRDILKATHTAAVFVTHDQEEALSIADRVAIMRQGRIEQLDTPETLYREPSSRFIAEFVTQANFIPADRQGQVWNTEIGEFLIDPIHCTCKTDWDNCQSELTRGVLMIRQEDIGLIAKEDGVLWVRDRQFLGRDYCYRLETASGLTLQVRTSTMHPIAIDTRVHLQVDHQSLRFFANPERQSSLMALHGVAG
jgi:iron(III) transport system ATP-binding protein